MWENRAQHSGIRTVRKIRALNKIAILTIAESQCHWVLAPQPASRPMRSNEFPSGTFKIKSGRNVWQSMAIDPFDRRRFRTLHQLRRLRLYNGCATIPATVSRKRSPSELEWSGTGQPTLIGRSDISKHENTNPN